MKKLFIAVLLISISTTSFTQEKLKTTSGHIKFFSTTPAEDIEANNYKVTSNLTSSTGVVVFSVPMQSFEFKKALMQKHYNSKKFLNTKKFPKAKFKGSITNLSVINFFKDGSYTADVSGDLTIHGITKKVSEKMTLVVKNGAVTGTTTFNITLADFGVVFTKGKPSKNIAKDVKITAALNYTK